MPHALPGTNVPGVGSSYLTATVAASVEQFKPLRAEWLLLRERFGMQVPNSDPDRFVATLHGMTSARPHVAIFRDTAEPRAAIIGRIERRRAACRVGYVRLRGPALECLDVVYGGLITDGTEKANATVVNHLRHLLCQGRVESIWFNHLPVEHPLHSVLTTQCAAVGAGERHWRFEIIPGSYEATMAVFSHQLRKGIRKRDRELLEHFGGDVVLRVFSTTADVGEFVPTAARLAARTYQAALGVGFSASPLWQAILRAEAEQGRLRCYWLECRGSPISFEVGVIYGSTYFAETAGYLPVYRDLSPGSVLHVRILQDLCNNGVSEYDFGFGDAEYKRIYGTQFWNERSLQLLGRGVRPGCVRLLNASSSFVSRLSGYTAKRIGLASWIKKKWRTLLVADHPS